ncbi:cupin-like domain-containing protein [Asticcacaulis endophyticus]|uniref:Cupin n=1 Tax=Asticcacaulis endophyticus TaxID=1395890 RepID=A0A918QFK8_9CAUL|nr:cupin-like domain-containing protein [Asticcacaulis endophyticus]GGZ44432.1 cupin [Asticcacaulis endophyticus]
MIDTRTRVYDNVTFEVFSQEIVPANRPAIMRGLVKDWPAVQAALLGDEQVVGYLKNFDIGYQAESLIGDPDIQGEFFYSDDRKGVNFERMRLPIPDTLDRMLALRGQDNAPSLYIQSVPIPDCLPEMVMDNHIPFIPKEIAPRIWVGTPLRVQTHYDLSNNIAALVAGKRRFTLFPPEQLANLYAGPLDFTLSGAPVSMVSLESPDLERYPRFAEALKVAEVADLEPGDALYIPYFWWHHVRSLEPFNILINYWWKDGPANMGSPYDALLHMALSIRDMPEVQRQAWKSMFDYYIFGSHGDPVAHLPPHMKGPLGEVPAQARRQLYQQLARNIAGKL